MMNVSKMIPLALVLGASIGLNGCLPAVLGGAAGVAVSGADRRTTGAQADDEVMEVRVKSKIQAALYSYRSATYDPAVSVVSYNRHILLMGQVAGEAERQLAERIAKEEAGAVKVYNHIGVRGIDRNFLDISNDTWITSKVRAALLNVPGVYPGHVKVVTYAGTTYVLGLLTPEQQSLVNAQVSTTVGVQRVVTLYQPYP